MEKKEYQTPKVNEIELNIAETLLTSCKTPSTTGSEVVTCWSIFDSACCKDFGT